MNGYQEILRRLEEENGLVLQRRWTGTEGSLAGMERFLAGKEDAWASGQEALSQGLPVLKQEGDAWELAEPYFPKERLIVLGGGHVALPVVEFGAKVGFLVTVVDDRLSFANRERFPMAEQVLCDRFSHAIEQLNITESDYVCILTRGHRYDADCLRQIGQGREPAYLGMIGSRRRVALVKEQLLAEGYNPERLGRLKSPIGLAIGGVTPAEIAISIVAELIQVKRLSREDKRIHSRSDLDFEVLRCLAEETEVPKALATVMASQGSSPRGAGASMIVYPDGRILGSIGGGCSEAAVLNQARRLVGTGRYQVIHVDLTGEAAEEEGMVCGGVMDVLVEDIPCKG